MELLNKVLQIVLETALPILVSALAAWAIGKAREVFKKLKDKNPELYEILKAVSAEAVKAAEQVYGSQKGQEKKAYALKIAEKYREAKGIQLDLEIISAYIEAAVKDMNDYGNPYEYAIEMLNDEEEEDDDEDMKHIIDDSIAEGDNI